jgi:hypothetical protein
MDTIYLHLPRMHTQRVIDITPVPWWRRVARAISALVIFVVAVPLLWLLGGLFALALLGGTAAMLVIGVLQAGRIDRAARRSASASVPCQPAS